MYEISPQTPNYDISQLSPEGKWLKANKWCSDLIKRSNELDLLARTGQDDNDKNSSVDVLHRWDFYKGLPVKKFRYVPRLEGNVQFGIEQVVAIFPLDDRVQDEFDASRLIFYEISFRGGKTKNYMITHNNFVDLDKALAKETPIASNAPESETIWGRIVQQLNKESIGNTNLSDDDLIFLRSLQYIFCDPKWDYGLKSFPPRSKKDKK